MKRIHVIGATDSVVSGIGASGDAPATSDEGAFNPA